MAQNDIFEVSFVVDVNGVPTVTVMHALQTAGGDPQDPNRDLWDAILTEGIQTEWQNRTSNEAILECVKVQKISPIRNTASGFFPNLTGQVTEKALQSQTACLHFWQAFPWSNNAKGRKYWSGVPITHHQVNKLTDEAFNLEAAFGRSFEGVLNNEAEYQFGVYSRQADICSVAQLSVRPRIVLRKIRNRRDDICAAVGL